MKADPLVNGVFVGTFVAQAGYPATGWEFWAIFALYYVTLVVAGIIDHPTPTRA